MPILHSFEENKLEYEDEDEVEIMIMGTEMDKESLEHNLHTNDITPKCGDGVTDYMRGRQLDLCDDVRIFLTVS
ncbi:hypothetical protein Tco_0661832 [Tanacetum coccineum]